MRTTVHLTLGGSTSGTEDALATEAKVAPATGAEKAPAAEAGWGSAFSSLPGFGLVSFSEVEGVYLLADELEADFEESEPI